MAGKPEAAKVEGEKIDFVELSAPAGWKKLVPKNNETPRRNAVLFISPTGEEIRNRKQLAKFLRSHPGGPPASEFDWKDCDTPRRSARLSGKAKTESPEEGPPKKRERKSVSNAVTKQEKNGDTEEEDDEVAESEKETTQEAEGIVDTEMKDVEDDSLKTGSKVKTIEECEIKPKASDQGSDENQEGKNENEPEKPHLDDTAKDVPVISEQNTDSSKIQENPEVKVVTSDASQTEEMIIVEETYKYEDIIISVTEATKEENSAVSDNNQGLNVEEGTKNAPVINVHEESGVDTSAEDNVPVLFVPEKTKDEDVVVRETPVDSVASHKADSIEELREKEVKDRTFFNDGFKWEQKKVPSS